MQTTVMICFGYKFDYYEIFYPIPIKKNSSNQCEECDHYRELRNPTPKYCGNCGNYLYYEEMQHEFKLKDFTDEFPQRVYEKNKNIGLYNREDQDVYLGYIFFIDDDSDLVNVDIKNWFNEMKVIVNDLEEILKENDLSGTLGMYTKIEYF